MKTVLIQRAYEDDRVTLGILRVENVRHDPIFTLENPLRASRDDSRIPAGTYNCFPYDGEKFKRVYLVRDVPDRSGILVHTGNFEQDTKGCILLGDAASMLGEKPAVMSSQSAMERFRLLIGQHPFRLVLADCAKP